MKVPSLFDAYSLRARLFPSLIAGASAMVAFFVLAPWDRMALPQFGAALASGVVLFALADIARRQGKRIEPGLYAKWGGKPSTVMLRHSDTTLDAVTKAKYHQFLAKKVNVNWPSATDEEIAIAECDAVYERCGNWIRENTRDTTKFKLLFDELITYGFRRNLLALKSAALVIDTVIVIGCAIAAWRFMPFDGRDLMSQKMILIGGIAIIHAAYVLIAASESSVREAANQYARQLLLCCENLGANVTPRRTKATAA